MFRITDILWYTNLALIITAFLLFFLWILKRRYPHTVEPELSTLSRKRIVHAGFVLFIGFLLYFGLRWGLSRFPLLDAQTVVFTLSMPLKGTDSEVFTSAVVQMVLPTVLFFIINLSLLIRIKKSIYCRPYLLAKTKKLTLAIPYTVLLIAVLSIFSTLPVSGYIYAVQQMDLPPVNSPFYEKYYVNPHDTAIRFPAKKKNLVFILLESMESSFADKTSGGLLKDNNIAEITRLAKHNINFSHNDMVGGGKDIFGTHWTIAAMIAKTCGIPFNIPIDGNTRFLFDFLPGAKGLTDILDENGYKQRFIFGSDKAFASRGTFFETHGNVEVRDLVYYKNTGKVPKDYHVFWGIEDAKLYDLAKEELSELSSHDKPFMFGMLTADTHHPSGYTCGLCDTKNLDGTEVSKIQTVFRCASKQAGEFISWIKSQSWYRDTVIVIMGDHLFMQHEFFPDDSKTIRRWSDIPINPSRRWINIFINSSVRAKKEKNREFSSFDMFPTILESMGVKISGHALGFGRSLFSDRPTLLEELKDDDYIEKELSTKSFQYDGFIYNTKN